MIFVERRKNVPNQYIQLSARIDNYASQYLGEVL